MTVDDADLRAVATMGESVQGVAERKTRFKRFNTHKSTARSLLGVSTLHQVAGQLASIAATQSLRYWVVQVLHATTRNLDERLYIYSRRLLQSKTINHYPIS